MRSRTHFWPALALSVLLLLAPLGLAEGSSDETGEAEDPCQPLEEEPEVLSCRMPPCPDEEPDCELPPECERVDEYVMHCKVIVEHHDEPPPPPACQEADGWVRCELPEDCWDDQGALLCEPPPDCHVEDRFEVCPIREPEPGAYHDDEPADHREPPPCEPVGDGWVRCQAPPECFGDDGSFDCPLPPECELDGDAFLCPEMGPGDHGPAPGEGSEADGCEPTDDPRVFRCEPPAECADRLYDTPDCTPPPECQDNGDGTFDCRFDGPGGPGAHDDHGPDDGVECWPGDEPDTMVCKPPPECEGRMYETPECTPPPECEDNGDGTVTCQAPEGHRRGAGPDGHDCGVGGCDLAGELFGDDEDLFQDDREQARQAIEEALRQAASDLREGLKALKVDYRAGVEELRMRYDEGRDELKATYDACIEDARALDGEAALEAARACRDDAADGLSSLKETLLAERDALRATTLDEAETLRTDACLTLASELQEAQLAYGLDDQELEALVGPIDLCDGVHGGGGP